MSTNRMESAVTTDRLLVAALSATSEQKQVALEVLRGALAGESGNTNHRSSPLPHVLSHDRTAELLAIGKRSLNNYVNRGWLRPFRPHGQRRALGFLESDVREFLASGAIASSCRTDVPTISGESTPKRGV